MNPLSIKEAIHTISAVLEIPAIFLLIAVVLVVVFECGSVLVEYFTERRGKRPDVPGVLERISGRERAEMLETLRGQPFRKGLLRAFERLLTSTVVSEEERRLIAGQLLSQEEARLERRLSVTDVIARIGPMFGLMATLIPLGPGLIALGQGDTKTLSDSLLTAFDATVAGLAAAGVAFILSKVRKRWYKHDLTMLETVLEGVVR
ncbi:MAG: MotA/TolQ/ExbB proton channel family protein [Clostridiales Family XIII bacterium]|nr:MotA/TolQ/ExbB proton channel family protein [Clostridiales Family XIII bacterium]